MLSRFSVRKPYIVIVAVIVCLVLGGVSLSKMKTDLLPDMDLPYLAVITTDVGASAEKVETEVTDVLESSLSTISGVSSVQSQSADNYSLIFLEFEDGTDMDSAMVKASSAVNEVASQLPDTAGTPNYLEISMDMMATLYVAASYDDHDIYEASTLATDTLVPALERVDGVADVSTVGTAEKSVEVRLSDSKIEDVNNKLLANVNSQLYDAKKQIDDGEAQLASAETQLAEQKTALEQTQTDTSDQLGQAASGLTIAISGKTTEVAALTAGETALKAAIEAAADIPAVQQELQSQLESLQEQTQASTTELTTYQSQLAQVQAGSVTAAAQFGSASAQIAAAETTLASSKEQLASARTQYEQSRETALASANVDALVDKSTLAALITAQNFSMPAGYLGTGADDDDQWLLRVGDMIESTEELSGLLLTTIDGVGDIRLSDVADITVVDNVGDSYMKINGADGVLLSVFKNSTANTSEVSSAARAELEELEEQNPGLHLTVVSDQASYIGQFINSLLQSLALGALLAVVVLALFLKNWKPTLIVAFSIPFSVLCGLLLMYFTGITLNIMSLGGISLAIGMLVDNSIIVLENIYRLRARGMPAARAAVQGAKQITGAVVASTLTTVCVFLPIVFTTGMVNQMLLPFALTIAYTLAASLVVALTLVPTVSHYVLKHAQPVEVKWFEHIKEVYAKSLSWALSHKVLPLGVAVVLLAVAVAGMVNTGVTLIPTMTSKTASVAVTMPDDVDQETAYATADAVMDAALSIDGVQFVGAMDGSASMSMLSSGTSSMGSSSVSTMYSFYVQVTDEVTTEEGVLAVFRELEEKTADLDCEVVTDASSSEAMSSLLGSGLSLTLKGNDREVLLSLSEDMMALVDEVEGYTEIDNGMEDADLELHLVVDRDKLTQAGYTVAQLYQDLASKLTTSTNATTMELDETSVDVTIVDERNELTRDNLLNTTISIANQATGETTDHALSEFATVEEDTAATTITHLDSTPTMTVTAEVEDGYNNALLARELEEKIDAYELPEGYTVTFGGEIENIDTMLYQMILMLVLGLALIYLVMVAQFESLLSPFIMLLTVPLAFTGGFAGLVFADEPLSMLSLMGFAVLMGTVVNNGIVFVDYVNQLRRGGLEKRDALIATGRTRLRPILMTALATSLAMVPLMVSDAIGASLERGMAAVVVFGLLYATLMTLYVVPLMYDLLYRRVPRTVDLHEDDIDEDPGDAQAYLDALRASDAAAAAEQPTEPIPATGVSAVDPAAEAEQRGWHPRYPFERK